MNKNKIIILRFILVGLETQKVNMYNVMDGIIDNVILDNINNK